MISVSVIIPTYNRCSIVKEAIESVLQQDYPELRCIVVDDCSADKTFEMISDEYSGRVDIYRLEKNRGQSFCRNFGAEKAVTEYITFLDSDDLLYKDSISVRASLLEDNSSGANCIPFGIMKTPGERWKSLVNTKARGEKLTVSEYLKSKIWCQNNGFIVKKNDFLKTGGYNTKLRDKEDIELILKLMTICEFRYAGKLIGEVRDICSGSRQRENHSDIIEQGNGFTDALKNNNDVMALLGEENFLCLLKEENEGLLRALYRNGNYKEFRKKFLELSSSDMIGKKKIFFRRYLLSFLIQFLN